VVFAIIVLGSQLLLIGLAIAWFIHMLLIMKHGQVFFTEDNRTILWLETIACPPIIILGIAGFIIQCKRLNEKRKSDRARPIQPQDQAE
jgi:hypothetical protein